MGGDFDTMTKFVKIFLLIMMIGLFCLNSIQLPSETNVSTGQSLFIEHLPFEEHATFLKDNNQAPSFFTILYLLCIVLTFLYVGYRSRIRRFLRSVIPILKRTFLLFPIKFESRYIALPPFI